MRQLDLCIFLLFAFDYNQYIIASVYQHLDTDKEKDTDEAIETESTLGEYIMSGRYARLLGACLQVKCGSWRSSLFT